MSDPEIDAMKAIATAMESIPPDGRERVLDWANNRYRQTPSVAHRLAVVSQPSSQDELGEFFNRAAPVLERDKALLVSYWLQVNEGRTDFPAQDVNSRLKDLGYRISNITDAFSQLQSEKPARVIQLRKMGSSKQARKSYRVTEAGKRWVEDFLTQAGAR